MQPHALLLHYTGAVPLLDDEFDKVDNTPSMTDGTSAVHIALCHDRAWEDQIDEGEEVSL